MPIDVSSLYNRRRDNRYDRVAVGDMLERVAYSRPDKEAIVSFKGAYAYDKYQRLTYKEADDLANQVANALLAKNLDRADRVLFMSENSSEAMIAKFGVAKARLVNVPVNPSLADDALLHIIKLTDPAFIIADDEYAERLEDLDYKANVVIPIKHLDTDIEDFDSFVSNQSKKAPELTIHGDDIWEILFTSGTTSLPKGAMISHHYTYFAAYDYGMKFTRGLPFDSDLRIMSFISIIYHVGDQTLPGATFLTGGTLQLGRRHDSKEMAKMITDEDTTALWIGSSELLIELINTYEKDSESYDFTTLTNVLYGYTPLAPEYHDHLKGIAGAQVTLWESFSQTEAIGGYRFFHDEHPDVYRRTAPVTNVVGKADPILGAKIIDEEGERIDQPNTPGEVVYRTPTMFSGYYKNKSETEKALEGDWFHSGDRVMVDENGLGIMVDRTKDMIKSGGESVVSSRVEGTIRMHQDVVNAAVIGVPDDKWGEMVVAFAIKKDESNLSEKDLIAHVRKRLAGFETPKQMIFVDELPESIAGKTNKVALKDLYQKKYIK